MGTDGARREGSGLDADSGMAPARAAGRSKSGDVPRGALAPSVAQDSRDSAPNTQSSTVTMLGPLQTGPARDPLLPSRGQALSSIPSEDRSDAGDDAFDGELHGSEEVRLGDDPLRAALTSSQHAPKHPAGS